MSVANELIPYSITTAKSRLPLVITKVKAGLFSIKLDRLSLHVHIGPYSTLPDVGRINPISMLIVVILSSPFCPRKP